MDKTSSKSHHLKRRLIRLGLYIAICLILLFLLFVGLTLLGTFGEMPDRDEIRKVSNYTASEVYSADNYLLGRYYLENRTNTQLKTIPKHLIQALTATEDARFYQHHGVDARSTFRVLLKSILLFDKSSGGGSTLTQQLAKNLYPRKNIGFLSLPAAKIREIILARRLETVFTKDQILELYLNTVPFGNNTYGIETAALVFFSKKTSALKVEEAAVLVGMLKGNTDFNPMRNYQSAQERRNVVIRQMVRYHYLDQATADALQKLPIRLNPRKLQHDEGPAPYFREYLRKELKNWAESHPKPDGSSYNIYTDGLKIYTTIDYQLQRAAESAVSDHLHRLQQQFNQHWNGRESWKDDPDIVQQQIIQSKRYQALACKGMNHESIIRQLKQPIPMSIATHRGTERVNLSPIDSIWHHFAMLQAGMLSMESRTGYVKAWVGGSNYKFFKYDHVTSQRQAGSTFKPFVYAAALEDGTQPCDFFANDSTVYTEYDNWTPHNSDRKFGGLYSMKGALTHSVNTVSAQLIMKTGIRKVIRLARAVGFEANWPEVPSLALGTGSVSVYELARAYSAFVNQGYTVEPVFIRRIEDENGKVIFAQGPAISEKAAFSQNTAETMLAMLQQVTNQGTAASLRTSYGFTSEIAAKTGTTQNHTDGWFVGVTPDLITAVWVGGDNPAIRFRSITYGQGAYMALPIFARFLQKFYQHPVYQVAQNSSFHIPPETMATLNCPDFKEQDVENLQELLDKTEESIGDFVRRIFQRHKKYRKDEND